MSPAPDLDTASIGDVFIAGLAGSPVATLQTVGGPHVGDAFTITTILQLSNVIVSAPTAFTIQLGAALVVGTSPLDPGTYSISLYAVDASANGVGEGIAGAPATITVHVIGVVVDATELDIADSAMDGPTVSAVNVSLATRPRAASVSVIVAVSNSGTGDVTSVLTTPLNSAVAQVVVANGSVGGILLSGATLLSLTFTQSDWSVPQPVYVSRNTGLNLTARLSSASLLFQLQDPLVTVSATDVANTLHTVRVRFVVAAVEIIAVVDGAVASPALTMPSCSYVSGGRCTIVWHGSVAEGATSSIVAIVDAAGELVTVVGVLNRDAGSLPAVGQLVFTVPYLMDDVIAHAPFRLTVTVPSQGGGADISGVSPTFTIVPPYYFVTLSTGSCTPDGDTTSVDSGVTCGSGWQPVNATCVASSSGMSSPITNCLAYSQAPRPRSRCFVPCGDARLNATNSVNATVYWMTGPWSSCQGCGTARQRTRVVTCVDPAGNVLPTTDDACAAAASSAPPSVQACAVTSCSVEYVYSAWGSCSARCGTGVAVRQVRCVDDSGRDLLDLAQCVAALGPPAATTTPCNATIESCDDAHYVVTPWSTCSQPCVTGLGVQAQSGVSTRSYSCVLNGTVVSNKECVQRSVHVPVTTQPCNVSPCSEVSFALRVGKWSTCSLLTKSGNQCLAPSPFVGVATRSVQCVQGGVVNGTALSTLQLCASIAGIVPATTQSCATVDYTAQEHSLWPIGGWLNSSALYCRCAQDSDCRTNAVCNTAAGVCACARGFTGVDCRIDSTRLPSPTTKCAGVVDATGVCCLGAIRPSDGLCCGNSTNVLDSSGECCDGVLDSCGVCNGDAVAVDIKGACCSSPLPPSGICCATTLDDCGECLQGIKGRESGAGSLFTGH